MSQIICYACKKGITGNYTEAYGNPYHFEHWTCKNCGDRLGDEFHSAKDGVNGLCDNCFFKCAHCNNTIRDKYIPEKDLKYHPDCHVQAFTKCVGCGNVITGQYIRAKNDRPYHLNCFTCTQCGTLIESNYIEKNGRPFCTDCGQPKSNSQSATRTLNVCSGCGNTIDQYQSMLINVGDKNFHEDCFKCDSCGVTLVNYRSGNEINFVQKRDGTNLCNNCYGNNGKTLKEISVPVQQEEDFGLNSNFEVLSLNKTDEPPASRLSVIAPPPPSNNDWSGPRTSVMAPPPPPNNDFPGPRASVMVPPPPPPGSNKAARESVMAPPPPPGNDFSGPRASIRIPPPPPPPMPGKKAQHNEPEAPEAVRLSVLLNQLDGL